MEGAKRQPATVDEYIAQLSPEVQRILGEVRVAIRQAAPEAEERISYGMPGYYLDGALVWFAGCKRHIGFYPGRAWRRSRRSWPGTG